MRTKILSFLLRNLLFLLVLLVILLIGIFSFPAASEDITTALDSVEHELAPLAISLGKLLAAALIIPLSALILWRLVKLTLLRPSDLVVENLSNASVYADLDKMLAGVSQLAREKLVENMEYVHDLVKENTGRVEPSTNTFMLPEALVLQQAAPLPRALKDQRLAELSASLKDVAPGQLKPVLQILGGVFLPRGTRVTGNLQRRGDAPDQLGITLEVADIAGQEVPEPRTIWEPWAQNALIDGSQDGEPPGTTAEDEQALSLYKLGELYEEKGAFDQAKAMYEAALKKQPSYPDAQEALKRVLGRKQAPTTERYISLLGPATYWLATRLSLKETVATVPLKHLYLSRKLHYRRDYRGSAHNFFGMLYQSSAAWFPKYAIFFYGQAIEEFKQSVRLRPDWYQPYENLADTYRLRGTNDRHGTERQRKAIRTYNRALRKAEKESASVIRRIRVGKATAQLLKGDIRKSRKGIKSVERGWAVASEKDARLLYNLACWYALAYGSSNAVWDAKKAVRRLTYSLIRNPKNLNWIDHDPDLASIRDNVPGSLTKLKDELSDKLEKYPKLPKGTTKTRERFKAVVDGIVNEVVKLIDNRHRVVSVTNPSVRMAKKITLTNPYYTTSRAKA